MNQNETTIWGIHAGKTGDGDTLFLKKNRVVNGWPPCGDLSKLSADREAFKEKLAVAYPNSKPGAIPTSGLAG